MNPVYAAPTALPAASLASSLDELARQHGVQILYPSIAVDPLRAPPVEGDFETVEVLDRLLAGTGLDYAMQGESVAIFRAGTTAPAIADTVSPTGSNAARAATAAPEEMIVTVLRRESLLDRIARSVQVFDSSLLHQRGVWQSGEIDPLSPGLEIGPNALGNPSISLRGIGANEASDSDIVPNSVAVYVDDVYQSSPIMNSFLLFDIQRVELLKGPQGTLYGRNSTTGAINFVTRRPGGDLDGQIYIDYGRFDEVNGEAAITLPLTGTLDVRIAGARQLGGANYRLVGGGDYGSADRSGLRLNALWRPAEPLQIGLLLQRDLDRSERPPGSPFGEVEIDAENPYYCEDQYFPSGDECTTEFGGVTGRDDLWRVNPNLPPAVDLVRNTLINRVQYDTDSLRLVGINGLVTLRQDAFADRDATEVARTQEYRSSDLDQLSSEWRLSRINPGPFDWLAGIYLSQNQVDNNRVFQNLSDSEIHFNSEASGSSGAIYAHAVSALNDWLDLTSGVRYTYEQRELFAESARVPANAGIPFDAVAGLGEQGAEYFLLPDGGERRDASWDNLSGELGLLWQVRPDLALYGSVSSGFKSGGYSGSFTISTNPPGAENRFEPYSPERTVQTEVGLRGTTHDRALKYELAAYHIDLRDRVEQVLVFDPSSENGNAARLVNAARAQIDGVDANFVWTPTARLTIQAALAWMDARYTRYLIDPDDPGNQLARDNNRSGFRLPQAPEVSAFLSVSDRIPLQRFGDLELGVAAEYTSSQFFNSRNARVVGQPGYALVHFSFSWQSADGKTTVGTYIDNVTNEKYAIYGTDAVDGVNLLTAGKQRSWRISFSYRF